MVSPPYPVLFLLALASLLLPHVAPFMAPLSSSARPSIALLDSTEASPPDDELDVVDADVIVKYPLNPCHRYFRDGRQIRGVENGLQIHCV